MFHSFHAKNREVEEHDSAEEDHQNHGSESRNLTAKNAEEEEEDEQQEIWVHKKQRVDTSQHDEEEEDRNMLQIALETTEMTQRKRRARIVTREKLLVVGVACLDVVDRMAEFPKENGEYRSLERMRRLGGNGANMARVAAQFDDLSCTLMYATAAENVDSTATYIRHCLEKCKVNDVGVLSGGIQGLVPTSFIIQCPGTRTIIHNRSLPELTVDDFTSVHIPFTYSWTHFEARNVSETKLMMGHVFGSGTISLEIEKERRPDDVMDLLVFADVVIFSEAFVRGRGFETASAFLTDVVGNPKFELRDNAKLVVAWGEDGAFGVCCGNKESLERGREVGASVSRDILYAPARKVKKVVDSVGAGDTFNAGLVVGLMRGETLLEAMSFGCQIAGMKCEQQGFDGLAPLLDQFREELAAVELLVGGETLP